MLKIVTAGLLGAFIFFSIAARQSSAQIKERIASETPVQQPKKTKAEKKAEKAAKTAAKSRCKRRGRIGRHLMKTARGLSAKPEPRRNVYGC